MTFFRNWSQLSYRHTCRWVHLFWCRCTWLFCCCCCHCHNAFSQCKAQPACIKHWAAAAVQAKASYMITKQTLGNVFTISRAWKQCSWEGRCSRSSGRSGSGFTSRIRQFLIHGGKTSATFFPFFSMWKRHQLWALERLARLTSPRLTLTSPVISSSSAPKGQLVAVTSCI